MLAVTTPRAPFIPGQGFADRYGRAYIVKIEPVDNRGGMVTRSALLIGGPSPMAAIHWTVTICREESLSLSEMDEHTIANRLADAPLHNHADPAGLLRDALAKRAELQAMRSEASKRADEMTAAATAELARLAPPGAVAAIVAELHEDDSDSMSDYHNHKTARVVVIGFSSHKRDLFPELRKAAATFPETAELADAPADAEHREKYSMGAGFYLKKGWRDSSGWCVKKSSLDWLRSPGLEFSDAVRGIAPPAAAQTGEAAAPVAAGRFTVSEHTHTRKGFQFFICQLADRVERSTFDALLSDAKARGGWYSRPWQGTPGGFAFKQQAAALEFVAANGGTDAPTPPPPGGKEPAPVAPAAPVSAKPGLPAKLRELADGMQSAIDSKFADRLSNTPKRARQAAEARNDGVQMERAQKILRALAAAHEAGTVPPCLANVTTKASACELAKEEIDRGRCGYYDAGRLTGRAYAWGDAKTAEQAAAAWALLGESGYAERIAAEELRKKIAGLQFAKIPGYFPTPAPLVARMLEAAALDDGARVLEPSAGSGAIADAVKAAGFAVECIERQATLCEILAAKGHSVIGGDFLELSPCGLYDAVLMNPPFEGGQDVAHVRHAFERFLKPGGRLVAIMGAGVTFRTDSKFASFREFVDDLGGEFEAIPAGTFKDSGTGVASVMVTLCKD